MCQKPIIMMKNVVDVRISRVKGRKIQMGRRRDENRKGGTVQKQLRYLPSKNDIGICFFLPPPYVRIEEMRCNILCGCRKRPRNSCAMGFYIHGHCCCCWIRRQNESAAVQLVRRRAHLSRFFHRQRQQKPRRKELASAAAALVATWLCVINCWRSSLYRERRKRVEQNSTTAVAVEEDLGFGLRVSRPLLVGVSSVAVQAIRTPARLSLSQQPSSF